MTPPARSRPGGKQMESAELVQYLWQGAGWPLLRLVFAISVGLMLGNLIESLNWTHAIARLASPVIRAGHLSETAGASFSVAFFSSVTANTMLSEAYEQGKISRSELVLANLFNSLPVYFLHLPTMFFIAVPMLKATAVVYVGLTLLAAFLRTVIILILGRMFLPGREICVGCLLPDSEVAGWKQAVAKAWLRFRRRIRTILLYTVPIYLATQLLQQAGFFDLLAGFIASRISTAAWLQPQSIGLIVLQLTAEISAGLAAAGALLDAHSLPARHVVLALLAGNVLSSPMRALRHQFPFYAGIFKPQLAMTLIFWNQLFRAASILLITFFYFLLTE